MPRIRKKTSKRGTTHQRSKIKKKAAESRRKVKKEAKKNPQWKSKLKKKQDPGIPNDFPFKEQILAEVAAQRRRDQEEKQRRKERKKEGEHTAAATASASASVLVDDQDELLVGFGEIDSSIRLRSSSARGSNASAAQIEKDDGDEEEDIEDAAPLLINRDYTNLRAVLDKADVVLHVLDARDPLACRSVHLEEYVRSKKGRKLVFVLNKIDTCPREDTETWVSELRRHAPTCLFRSASAFLPLATDAIATNPRPSASTSKSTKPETRGVADAFGSEPLLKLLTSEAKEKEKEDNNNNNGPLHVAIVGIANTGKSSIMNSLLRKSSSPIYKLTSAQPGPSTTERPVEAIIEREGCKIVLIDTPALAWERLADVTEDKASKQRARDMLLRNKGRIDKAKDPMTPVTDIISRANNEDLMLFYTLPAFPPGAADIFFAALARARGLVKRHGEPDIEGAARVVLRDWSTGRLPRYAKPASASKKSAAAGAGAPISVMAAKTGKDAHADSDACNAGNPPPPPCTAMDATEDGDAMAILRSADEVILSRAAPTRKEMLRSGRGIVRLVSGEAQDRKVRLDAPWDGDLDRHGEEEEAIARANGKERLGRLPGLGEGLLGASLEDEEDENESDDGDYDEDEDEDEGEDEDEDDDDDDEEAKDKDSASEDNREEDDEGANEGGEREDKAEQAQEISEVVLKDHTQKEEDEQKEQKEKQDKVVMMEEEKDGEEKEEEEKEKSVVASQPLPPSPPITRSKRRLQLEDSASVAGTPQKKVAFAPDLPKHTPIRRTVAARAAVKRGRK